MTNYPAQIDTSISLPSAVDNLTPVTGSIVNRLRDAILSVEKELGVKPSGIYTTVADRIKNLENDFGSLQLISLAGDLGGTLSSPLVIGIQGRFVSSAPPSLNNVLVWSGIAWVPSAVPGGTTGGFASGDLSGNYPGPMTVTKIQNNSIKVGTLGISNDGYVLTWVNANSDWEAKPAPVGFSAGGDLSGTATSQTLAAIKGKTLSSALATIGTAQDGYQLTWVNANNDWEAKPPAGTGTYPLTGSSVLAYTNVAPANLNVSTDGPRDWLAPAGNTNQNFRGTGSAHSKLLGSRITLTFDFIQASGWTLYSQAGTTAVTATASDDLLGGLSANTNYSGGYTGGSTVGFGFRFKCPADTFTRTLKIYASSWSCAVTLTATASDGSFVTVTDVRDAPASTNVDHVWTLTYNAARDGQEIIVSILVTTNHGASPNLKFGAITLA